MLFTRNYRYDTTISADEIKKRLIGQHVKVHRMDFEIYEKDNIVKIIPHAEQETNIKTLPITHVEFAANGVKTKVRITSKMRKIDKGGPMILLTFVFFMLAAALFMLLYLKDDGFEMYALPLFGISLLVFIIFWYRLERGYFDYIRKIRDYVKHISK
ncbi:MAG: hypothetical protein ABI378_15855 [Chitinophagaceae bacterium]